MKYMFAMWAGLAGGATTASGVRLSTLAKPTGAGVLVFLVSASVTTLLAILTWLAEKNEWEE